MSTEIELDDVPFFQIQLCNAQAAFTNFIVFSGVNEMGHLNPQKRLDKFPNVFSTIRLAQQCL